MTTPVNHTTTFQDWLNDDPDLAGRERDGTHVDASKPIRDAYWVLFGGSPEELDDHRATKRQDPLSDAVYEWTVRSVAPSKDGALAVASKVFAHAVGAELTLADRRLDPVEYVGGTPVKYDPGFPFPVFFVDDRYRLVSRRG